MQITSTKIRSIHPTLSEAVKASGMDISYNPSEAKRSIKIAEQSSGKAYVIDNGDVYYLYHCDIKVFNKFTPFMACISDSPFQVVKIDEDEKEIITCHLNLPKGKATRKVAAVNDLILTCA